MSNLEPIYLLHQVHAAGQTTGPRAHVQILGRVVQGILGHILCHGRQVPTQPFPSHKPSPALLTPLKSPKEYVIISFNHLQNTFDLLSLILIDTQILRTPSVCCTHTHMHVHLYPQTHRVYEDQSGRNNPSDRKEQLSADIIQSCLNMLIITSTFRQFYCCF